MCQIQEGTAAVAKTRPFALHESVSELIAWGTSFRDPYAAFSAAISVHFTVAGAGSDIARQIHRPATARAQVIWIQAISTHHTDSDFPRRIVP